MDIGALYLFAKAAQKLLENSQKIPHKEARKDAKPLTKVRLCGIMRDV